MTTTWSVFVQGRTRLAVSADQVAELGEHLSRYDTAASGNPEGFSVHMSIAADDPPAAAAAALQTLGRAARKLKLPEWSPSAVEILTEDEMDRRVQEPSLPTLAGMQEVAGLLGVTRARVNQLLAEHSDFPEPVQRVAMGPLWVASTISAYGNRRPRTAGRPAAAARPPIAALLQAPAENPAGQR